MTQEIRKASFCDDGHIYDAGYCNHPAASGRQSAYGKDDPSDHYGRSSGNDQQYRESGGSWAEQGKI